MPNLPELVKNHCATCEAETERIVNDLVQELADLKAAHEQEINEWRHNQDMCFKAAEQSEKEIKERDEEIDRLKQQPSMPPEMTYFIDLITPHVERLETYFDRLMEADAEIVRTFRKIKPKGAA